MGLYERLMGLQSFKIPVHQFQAVLAEVARGNMTGAQAQAAIEAMSGAQLSAAEVVEAQALLATLVGTAGQKLAKAKEIDDVLLLAEHLAPGYNTALAVRTRLGV